MYKASSFQNQNNFISNLKLSNMLYKGEVKDSKENNVKLDPKCQMHFYNAIITYLVKL